MREAARSTLRLAALTLCVGLAASPRVHAGDEMVSRGDRGTTVAMGNDGVGGIEKKRGGNTPAPVPPSSGAPTAPAPGLFVPPAAPPPSQDASVGGLVDLGGGLAGPHSRPRLDWVVDTDGVQGLRVTDGPAGAEGWLVVGLELLQAPLRGGVLMPTPDLILPTGDLDPSGAVFMPASVEGMTAPMIVFQVWMTGAGPQPSLSATNGLALITD